MFAPQHRALVGREGAQSNLEGLGEAEPCAGRGAGGENTQRFRGVLCRLCLCWRNWGEVGQKLGFLVGFDSGFWMFWMDLRDLTRFCNKQGWLEAKLPSYWSEFSRASAGPLRAKASTIE